VITGAAPVEVVPATVTPVFQRMRETAQVCNQAGGRLATHTPVMPPRFLLGWRPALDAASVSLRLLALDLEAAFVEAWSRLAQIEAAGGGDMGAPVAELLADMGNAARCAWGELDGERGFDGVVDPVGQRVHLAMGAADAAMSLLHTAAILYMGTPFYGLSQPGGREARQELVAMGINLTRLAPAWMVLEPEDGGSAYTETLGRIIDWPDLQRGDVFRWAGHLGAGVAIHPNEAPAKADDAALAEIERLAALPHVRAVGETGLDYYRTGPADRPAQQRSFRAHIDIAKRTGTAVMIHDREAHADVLRILAEEGAPEQVVFHCFSGDAAMARACADRGHLMSFAGNVTFKNAGTLREAALAAPLEMLLVETDAPFLAPMPYRGRPNAPHLVPFTLRFLAQLKGVDLDDLCHAVTANAERAFGPA